MGYPQMMVYFMENPIKVDHLRGSAFMDISIHVYSRSNYCDTNLFLLRAGLSEVAQNLHNGQGTTIRCPFVIPRGVVKSLQPIGDEPNLCIALNLTNNFLLYSCIYKNM